MLVSYNYIEMKMYVICDCVQARSRDQWADGGHCAPACALAIPRAPTHDLPPILPSQPPRRQTSFLNASNTLHPGALLGVRLGPREGSCFGRLGAQLVDQRKRWHRGCLALRGSPLCSLFNSGGAGASACAAGRGRGARYAGTAVPSTVRARRLFLRRRAHTRGTGRLGRLRASERPRGRRGVGQLRGATRGRTADELIGGVRQPAQAVPVHPRAAGPVLALLLPRELVADGTREAGRLPVLRRGRPVHHVADVRRARTARPAGEHRRTRPRPRRRPAERPVRRRRTLRERTVEAVVGARRHRAPRTHRVLARELPVAVRRVVSRVRRGSPEEAL
eukprot:Rhum_TRINITY_DN14806_c3_g1::Rhum_TRINITY_DN14806_c3_g1_i1::g.120078::m.120078